MARTIDPSTLVVGAGIADDVSQIPTSEMVTNKVNRPGDKMSGKLQVKPGSSSVAVEAVASGSNAGVRGSGQPGIYGLGIDVGTGVSGRGGDTDGVGVLGIGTAAGTGVSGQGGNTAGTGVSGTGGGVGTGVFGYGGSGGGVGIEALSAGDSPGLVSSSPGAGNAIEAYASGAGAGLLAVSASGPGISSTGGTGQAALDALGGTDAPAIKAWAGGDGPTSTFWSSTSGLSNQSGNFQAGSTASAVVLGAGASATHNIYVGWRVDVGAGADSLIENDFRYVVSYDGTTKTALVSPPFTGTPSVGDPYTLRAPSAAALFALAQPGGYAARLLGGSDVHRSTVDDPGAAATVNTFNLLAGSASDGAYVGWNLSIAGQKSRCTGYVGATKTLTVSPDLSAPPAHGTDILLLDSSETLILTAPRVYDGVNATTLYNGVGLSVDACLGIQISNFAGQRGHLRLVPSTTGLPANASVGEVWSSNSADKDLFYRDNTGWLNISALARRSEYFSGKSAFVQDYVGTWVDPSYAVSGAAVVLSGLGYDFTDKHAFQPYTCTALDTGLSSLSLGWEIVIPPGFQNWTDLVFRFSSSVGTGEAYLVSMLDTGGNAVTLSASSSGTIPNTSIQTITVTVTDGVYTEGSLVRVFLKIQPDNATAQLKFYGLSANYRA